MRSLWSKLNKHKELILKTLTVAFTYAFNFFSSGEMGKSDQAEGLTSPHAEASKLLEAALQQMDGIISGKLSFASLFK